MVRIGIRQSLQYVADHPVPATDVQLELPAHEMVSRTLFEIANNPDARDRGSLTRAHRAQKLIANRLVGTRRPGTHPVARERQGLRFVDLTQGMLE